MSNSEQDGDLRSSSHYTSDSIYSSMNSSSTSSKGEVILIITVDIGKGRKENIQIREHDEPHTIAVEFCKAFKLKDKMIPILAFSIEEQIEKLIEEEMSNSTPPKTTPKHDSVDSENIGSQLYYKGLKMKAKQQLRSLELRKAEEERISTELTFTPKINLLTTTSSIGFGSPTRFQIRNRLLNRLDEDCTFNPKISDKSKMYARDKSVKRDSIHQELYREAELRDIRNFRLAEEYNKTECPFKPDITLSTIDYVSNKRLDQLYRKQNRNQSFDSILHILTDPYTGQEFFKPRIGRSPRKVRNAENLPIGDYLYQTRSSVHSHSKEVKKTHKPINKWSERLFYKLKMNRYQDIFHSLNPDSSGRISADKVILDKLPKDLFNVLRPFLEEFDEIEEPLNFKQFVEAMDNLLDILNPLDRGIFLKQKKEKDRSNAPEHDFMPGIKRQKKSEISKDIYSRYMHKTQEKELKLTNARINNIIQETKECTFKPQIRYYKAQSSITKKMMKSISSPDLFSNIHSS